VAFALSDVSAPNDFLSAKPLATISSYQADDNVVRTVSGASIQMALYGYQRIVAPPLIGEESCTRLIDVNMLLSCLPGRAGEGERRAGTQLAEAAAFSEKEEGPGASWQRFISRRGVLREARDNNRCRARLQVHGRARRMKS